MPKEEAHRNKAVRLFSSRYCRLYSALQTSALPVHVLYDDVIDLAERSSVFQNEPGLISVEVDLDRIPVSADSQKAVALEVLDDVAYYMYSLPKRGF